MAVRIRLKRTGREGKRHRYRLVVMQSGRARDSRSIEEIGFYDPTTEPPVVKVNKERLEYWIKNGAQMSETVRSLMKRR